MTADQGGAPPQAGGARVVQRLLRRISAARSERSARGVVRGLVARPPTSLAELERLVGRLDVDPAGDAIRVRRGDLRPPDERDAP